MVDTTGEKPVKQWHLKPEGLVMARNFANCLEGRGIEHLYCSSQIKAFETAACLAPALEVPITVDEGFQEVAAGVIKFLGKRYTEIMKYLFEHQDIGLLGQEPFRQAKERFLRVLKEKVLSEETQGVRGFGIVAHSGVLSLVYQGLAGGELDEIESTMKMPDVATLGFNNRGTFDRLIEPFGQHILEPVQISAETKEQHAAMMHKIDQALREGDENTWRQCYTELGFSIQPDSNLFTELQAAFMRSESEWAAYKEAEISLPGDGPSTERKAW